MWTFVAETGANILYSMYVASSQVLPYYSSYVEYSTVVLLRSSTLHLLLLHHDRTVCLVGLLSTAKYRFGDDGFPLDAEWSVADGRQTSKAC